MRIIDTKYARAVSDPKQNHALQLFPQLPPVWRLEVEGKDILIFLRRVLRILNRAVGTGTEPFRVFSQIRMVGRALERKIQRNLDIAGPGICDQPVKVFQSA